MPPDGSKNRQARDCRSWYFQRYVAHYLDYLPEGAGPGPKHWKQRSQARNKMFARTHSVAAPWIVVRADDEREARPNLIRVLLSRFDVDARGRTPTPPDPEVLFRLDQAALENRMIAP